VPGAPVPGLAASLLAHAERDVARRDAIAVDVRPDEEER
jgi:hypothetical protein